MANPAFKVGDIVRLKAGWTAKEVAAVVHEKELKHSRCYVEYDKHSRSGYYLVTRYLHYKDEHLNDLETVRCIEDFVFWDGDALSTEQEANRLHQQKENEPMNKLYQIIGEDRFGTFLANNSEGKIVLEMKGEGGKVEAFDKDKVEEVKPYTYKCRAIATTSQRRIGQVAHLEGEKGVAKKGELIIRPSGTIYVVEQANSKAKPTGKLYGTVVEGRTIPRPDSNDDDADNTL